MCLWWGLCALRHGIQISMDTILACHPARSTEWLDCHPKSCELWLTQAPLIICYLLTYWGFFTSCFVSGQLSPWGPRWDFPFWCSIAPVIYVWSSMYRACVLLREWHRKQCCLAWNRIIKQLFSQVSSVGTKVFAICTTNNSKIKDKLADHKTEWRNNNRKFAQSKVRQVVVTFSSSLNCWLLIA